MKTFNQQKWIYDNAQDLIMEPSGKPYSNKMCPYHNRLCSEDCFAWNDKEECCTIMKSEQAFNAEKYLKTLQSIKELQE